MLNSHFLNYGFVIISEEHLFFFRLPHCIGIMLSLFQRRFSFPNRLLSRGFRSTKRYYGTMEASVNKDNIYIVHGKKQEYEINVGLEIHAQITSHTKLFSPASTSFGDVPNSQVSIIDAALPGTLPIINEACVDQAIKTGLAIKGTINPYSNFDRKHYFYCDMPTGYQITQYYHPIVENGELNINLPDNSVRTVKIERIQLETDSGKSLHDQHPTLTYVDLNRAGSALMEIISEPNIRSPSEAGAFVKKLQYLLRHIGACDGNMEEGSLRCDVNVSVKPIGSQKMGNRCEVKNINSIKAIMRAIEFEANRHVEIIESGGTIEQETRFYEPTKKTTLPGRRKEDAVDYRFFPEPDLPQLYVDEVRIQKVASTLPELPDEVRNRLISHYGLDSYDADVLSSHLGSVQYFEDVTKGRDPIEVSKWITNDIFGRLNEKDIDIHSSPVSSVELGELLDLIQNGTISKRIAKDILDMKFEGETKSPAMIVKEKGLNQVSDENKLEAMCIEVLKNHPKEIEEYKNGRDRRMKHFVGLVMKETKGKASGPMVTEIFERLIKELY